MSEKGADFGVDSNVAGGVAADEIQPAAVHREVDIAADVVVLIERAEEFDGLFGIESECFERDGFAPLFGERGVAVDYFLETQHFANTDGSTRTTRVPPGPCPAQCIAAALSVEARRLAAGALSGKMLVELKTNRRTCL
jgi:hypothetical protein